jgi:hypothetical protein
VGGEGFGDCQGRRPSAQTTTNISIAPLTLPSPPRGEGWGEGALR